jgi:hypothetical protein
MTDKPKTERTKQPVYQLDDGTWSHKWCFGCGFKDRATAAADYRFCCEWMDIDQEWPK